MKTLLWLDDYRDPMKDNWLVFSPLPREGLEVYWVKSYPEFIEWILNHGLPDAICFDHDLADGHYHQNMQEGVLNYNSDDFNSNDYNKTGYHCAKWLIEYCMDNKLKLPLYNIQSANPVGKENIDKLLKNYLKYEKS